MDEPVKVTKECIYDKTPFALKFLHAYIFPTFFIGYRKTLDFDDLPVCPKLDEPLANAEILEKNWNKEVERARGKNDEPNIFKVLIQTFGKDYVIGGQSIFYADVILRLSQPFLVGILVNYLTNGQKESDQPMAITSGVLIVITSVLIAFCRHWGWFYCSRVGTRIRNSFATMIYKKVMRMSQSSLKQTDMGHIGNMLSNDLSRFEEAAYGSMNIVTAPIMAVVIFYMTISELDAPSLGGAILLMLFIPFQGYMGRMSSLFRGRTTKVSDQRIRLMGEVISAMKLIKLYCWEEPFGDKISQIRANEVNTLKYSYLLKGINTGCSFVGTRLMLYTSFITYVLMGNTLTAEKVFTLMSVYNACKIPIVTHFPKNLGFIGEAIISAKRIRTFLLMEEKVTADVAPSKRPKGTIVCHDLFAKWTSTTNHDNLMAIDATMKPAQLTIVCGSVGSGKTCLLMSILRETSVVAGFVEVSGQISYAPQESWSFGGSIRDNILFGSPYVKSRYDQVIQACGLERDLQLFPEGDSSYVGEKGYTLSGGQKARVSLARAVYRDSDVYLLDDPLSAVDPKVANHIFNNCIRGFLKGKTVVLCTHQLQFLPQADVILVLDNGRLTGKGSFEHLMNSSNSFLNFVQRKEQENEEEKFRRESANKMKSMSISNKSVKSESEGDDDGEEDEVEVVKSIEKRLEEEEERKRTEMGRRETKKSGSLSWSVYGQYIRYSRSWILPIICLLLTTICQALYSFTDLWLSAWTQHNHPQSNASSSTVSLDYVFDQQEYNAIFYSTLIICIFALSLGKTLLMYLFCLKAGVNIHNWVFHRLMTSKILFFENNPTGRILNRFTTDIGVIDQNIPATLAEFVDSNSTVIGIIVVTVMVDVWLLIPVSIMVLVAIPARDFYVRSSREIQRLDSIARSPVLAQMTTTYEGLTTIRSFGLEGRFQAQYMRFLQDSAACKFLVIAGNRVISVMLDTMTNVYIACICILLLAVPEGYITGGDAGVILTSSMLLLGTFQYSVKVTTDLENQMVSCERVFEYGNLEQEDQSPGKMIKSIWPQRGDITFTNIFMRYGPGLPQILKGVSFHVDSGYKVGIVGRTGAGKSSLIYTLFRMIEVDSGTITIDGVNIRDIKLKRLRSKIGIIPQDPSLFSGSVRLNMDPLGEFSDNDIWRVLENANLAPKIRSMDGQLDGQITEGGGNLSVGQRQLLCLARALLKRNQILVLDEATANVDQETDELIQTTLKFKCEGCTVLTVAHRLNTIIDMDKVIVMDAGVVAEFDSPHLLLQNVDGIFHSMVKQTGPKYEKMLHKIASDTFFKRLIGR